MLNNQIRATLDKRYFPVDNIFSTLQFHIQKILNTGDEKNLKISTEIILKKPAAEKLKIQKWDGSEFATKQQDIKKEEKLETSAQLDEKDKAKKDKLETLLKEIEDMKKKSDDVMKKKENIDTLYTKLQKEEKKIQKKDVKATPTKDDIDTKSLNGTKKRRR